MDETQPILPVMLDGQTVQGLYFALNNIAVPKGVFSEEELEIVNILLDNMKGSFDAAQAGIEPEEEDIFPEEEKESEEEVSEENED